jgi:uncharacterized repeat protein (TIGR03803 family)
MALLSIAYSLSASAPALAASEKIIFSFPGGADGNNPFSLAEMDGVFYGVAMGGAGDGGMIFSVTPAGVETVLYAFNGTDGYTPSGPLTRVGRKFYGTTIYGGKKDLGAFYSVTPAGKEQLLYSFQGGNDGKNPRSSLIDVGGTLYGTTTDSVFKMTKTGEHTVLHIFGSGKDGAYCGTPLIYVNGMFYGTTYAGGEHNRGTVFSLTTEGDEQVIYSFQGRRDGKSPNSGLTSLEGTLYGTTEFGGDHKCGNSCGTIYTITASGVETVLHRFQGNDGAHPAGNLLAVGDRLYGAAEYGGAYGAGTIFKLKSDGHVNVVYAFQGIPDGSSPNGPLVKLGNVFYGTTYSGGPYHNISNLGTVFQITP